MRNRRGDEKPLRVDLHLTMHDGDLDDDRHDNIIQLLHDILERGEILMAQSDDILAKVEAQSTLVASVKTLIQELRANVGDPVKMQQILDGLDRNSQALSDALVTPGPGPDPVDPVPPVVA